LNHRVTNNNDYNNNNNNNNNNNKEGDVAVLWNQAVHTDTEVTANRPDVIIKNKKRESLHTDRCGNTGRQKCCAYGSGKEVKIQEFM
jgi:hypothetical protein